ncbi:helix-turn-helix domain-containing protein [Salininema proteolyticum]|uniref:Helix-turn-helix domain-containing protein n=1 Tax=Salininema proteolyticum TaxID=1607685 RepID=A0ABV8TU84_9ACTN
MAEPKQPTWRARWLGSKLKDLRVNKSLNAKQVAVRLECSSGTVSHYERGIYPVSTRHLQVMLDMYSVGDPEERRKLLSLAEDVASRGWVESLIDVQDFADYVWAESKSEVIDDFQVSVIPGLLQVESYAEALLSRGPEPRTPSKVRELVEIRMGRASRLLSNDAPACRFLLHEAVLHQRFDGVDVQVFGDQLRYLLTLAERDNVSLRLLPYNSGLHNMLASTTGFTILQLSDAWPTIAHVETPLGAVVAETPDCNQLVDIFDRMWTGTGLDERRTIDLIDRMVKEVER